MPVEGRRRHALHHQVTTALGEEAADTLFELIAPAGQQPATKQDLERGFEQVDQQFAMLESRMNQRFAELTAQLERRTADAVTTQTRTLVLSQLAALVAIAALAFGLR